ncbi:hypothetical protein [Bradyrhizobium sp. 8-10B]|uniref:hypothetical protein n=1 Tax=Bradyrhizobium sp. 8-10B TaxID=3344579 RepID=UPI0035BFA29B
MGVIKNRHRIYCARKAVPRFAATTVPTVKHSSLNDTEIKRMAEWVYVKALAWDERVRFGGSDEQKRIRSEIIRLEGTVEPPRILHEQWPARGMCLAMCLRRRSRRAGTRRAK